MNITKAKIATLLISEELDNLEDEVVLDVEHLSERIGVFSEMLDVELDEQATLELAKELLVLLK